MMKVDDLRIGQMVQWHEEGLDVPPSRVVGLREKFSRSPDLRMVVVHLWFDRPLFPNSILDKTYKLWVSPEALTLISAKPWSGYWEAEAAAMTEKP